MKHIISLLLSFACLVSVSNAMEDGKLSSDITKNKHIMSSKYDVNKNQSQIEFNQSNNEKHKNEKRVDK